jgi:hypothetical protein
MGRRPISLVVPCFVFLNLLVSGAIRADDWTPLWTADHLSQARGYLAATAVDGKILFAGGDARTGLSDVVDIYDSATGAWSVAHLSCGRNCLAAASAGNQALIGGRQGGNAVDIYDASTGTWTHTPLSQSRYYLAAAAANGKVLFGGGSTGNASSPYSKAVDI